MEAASGGWAERIWDSAAVFIFLALLSITAFAYAGKIFFVARENIDRLDFSHYYTSSYMLRRGMDPYAADLVPIARALGFETPDVTHATNPPTLVLLLEPLTLFRPHVAYWIWFAMNVGFLGVFVALAITEFGVNARAGWALACLTLMYPPLATHFHYAQAQILILVALMLAIRFLRRGYDAAAGAMVALAVLVKIFPIFMAGYFIARRRWKALGYMALWGAIGAALTIWATGVDTCVSFIKASALITSPHWLAQSGNTSINGLIMRSIGFAIAEGASRNWLLAMRPLVICVELGVFAITVLVSAHAEGGHRVEASAFALWVVATIMLAPTAWLHYFVLLLIPLWQIAASAVDGRASRHVLWTAAASYFATYVGLLGIEQTLDQTTLDGVVFAWEQLRFAAPLLAYLATYWLMREVGADVAGASIS